MFCDKEIGAKQWLSWRDLAQNSTDWVPMCFISLLSVEHHFICVESPLQFHFLRALGPFLIFACTWVWNSSWVLCSNARIWAAPGSFGVIPVKLCRTGRTFQWHKLLLSFILTNQQGCMLNHTAIVESLLVAAPALHWRGFCWHCVPFTVVNSKRPCWLKSAPTPLLKLISSLCHPSVSQHTVPPPVTILTHPCPQCSRRTAITSLMNDVWAWNVCHLAQASDDEHQQTLGSFAVCFGLGTHQFIDQAVCIHQDGWDLLNFEPSCRMLIVLLTTCKLPESMKLNGEMFSNFRQSLTGCQQECWLIVLKDFTGHCRLVGHWVWSCFKMSR